ncbi:hypothetical protein WJX82_009621 [Trebouxia sp. C0006]
MSAPSLSEWSVVEGDQTSEISAESLENVQAALPEARQAADLSLPNTPVQEFVAVFTMLLIFGWIYVGPLFAMASVWYLTVYGSKLGLAGLLVLASMSFWPAHPYWPAFVHSSVWDCWRRYFQYSYITPPLPYRSAEKHCLYTHFPHGSFPMGSWLSVGANKRQDSGMPERTYAFGASLLLALPIVRHVMSWMGVVPASKHVMLDVLSKASGGAMPEGIAGIFTGASRAQERIYLSKRKGFVKVAMQAGADIVPTYILGQSQVFVYKGSETLSRRLRCAIGIFYGRWYLPIPNKIRLTVLVGKPINVAKIEDPDASQIEKLHAEVVQQVKDLYYSHRHLHGWEDRELEIV